MDTSQTYIVACGKAGEIQRDHEFIYGDVWTDNSEEAYIVLPLHFPVSGCVWLPRQDQLQEMVFGFQYPDNDNDTKLAQLISDFYNFTMSTYRRYFTSMEQLWLAFVMKELYTKEWDGNEWVKNVCVA